MKSIRIVIVILAAILTQIMTALPATGQESAQIRFVHVDPGSPALDVFVNGELVATDVTYGSATTYMGVQAGEVELTANLATTSVQLLDKTLSLDAESTAVILSSRADGTVHLAADDLSELAFGKARFSLVNSLDPQASVSLADAIDGLVTQAVLAGGSGEGPHEVDAGSYEVSLHSTESGTEAASQRFEAALAAGTSHLLIIHGGQDEPQLLSLASATEGGDDSGRIRFVHAVAGAAPLDVRINDQLILPALAFAAPSQHIALPSGPQRIALFVGPAEIISEQFDIRAGQMSTLAIMGSNAGLKMRSFSDSADKVDESSAVVSLINAIPGSVISHLQLEGGAIAAFNVPFGEAGDAAKIVPGTQSMTVHLDIGDDRGAIDVPARHFAGGAYYNLIALAGGAFSAPRLLIAETSVQRQAPAMTPMMAQEGAEEDAQTAPAAEQQLEEQTVISAAAEEESAPETEASPVEEAEQLEPSNEEQADETHATDSSAVSGSMPAEDDEPAETEAGPDEAAAAEINNLVVTGNGISGVTPYAIVVVNPDSALHVRQYPSSDAMSLGLLPAASDLLVLGRRAPADLDSDGLSLLPVYLHDFTADPAAELLPYQDLPADDTWLFVVYVTPDGGALYGWVNAFYLQVFDHEGEPQRLASLAPVGQDQLGGASNTDIRPPSLADHVAARVVGLDSGAFLNLRIGNGASTEVLTQVAADSVLGFIGLDAAGEWAYVRYESPQGNLVTGWASMEFIQLLLNGKPALAASLRALDPAAVRVISDGVSGVIRPADASESHESDRPMSGIVGEVNVNFGSALHLRRYPDATSESLALIPRGMQLYLDGVTESGGWYKVYYEGDIGWVAGDYLILSMDGRQYARAFLDGQLPRFTDQGS
ncbi:MAG: DUF4397 domain-containing protein [Anaerolineae bacterium]|nr:DUF4397 domain-containing protein [Anaerolineae bacterium]